MFHDHRFNANDVTVRALKPVRDTTILPPQPFVVRELELVSDNGDIIGGNRPPRKPLTKSGNGDGNFPPVTKACAFGGSLPETMVLGVCWGLNAKMVVGRNNTKLENVLAIVEFDDVKGTVLDECKPEIEKMSGELIDVIKQEMAAPGKKRLLMKEVRLLSVWTATGRVVDLPAPIASFMCDPDAEPRAKATKSLIAFAEFCYHIRNTPHSRAA